MPFPKRLLNPNEEIVIDIHPHWWFFAGPASAGLGVLALLFAVLQTDGDVRKVLKFAWLALFVVWLVWLARRILLHRTTHFVVTSERLVFRSGILAKSGQEIPLERINDIRFNQSIFERMLGAGDLLIESGGEMGQQRFTDIPNPEFVHREIYRQIEDNNRRTAEMSRTDARAIGDAVQQAISAQAPATPVHSIPDQIAALAKLRDEGHITVAEFEQKKADLLGRM